MSWVGPVAKEGQKTGEKRQPAAHSVNESESHLRHHHPVEKCPPRCSLTVTDRDDKWLNGRDPKEGTPGWVRDHGHVSSPLTAFLAWGPMEAIGKSTSLRHRQDSGGISLPGPNPHRSPWPSTPDPPWSACALPTPFYFLPWPSCQHTSYTWTILTSRYPGKSASVNPGGQPRGRPWQRRRKNFQALGSKPETEREGIEDTGLSKEPG